MTDSLTDKLQVLFPEIGPRTVLDCTVIDIDPQAVPQVMERLKTYPDLGFSLLLDITASDYLTYPQNPAARVCVVYTLRNWERNWLLQVRSPVADPERGVESVAHLWGSADWAEREVYDQYGIIFRNHPDLRRILNHWQFEGHPLRKDYDIFKGQICYEADSLEKEIRARLASKGIDKSTMQDINTEMMFLNLGPSHPATHGAIRIFTALDGETIMANVNEIGYRHRGSEQTAENPTYNHIVPLTDRLNYCSALMNNIAYV